MRFNDITNILNEGKGIHEKDFDIYLNLSLDSASNITLNLNTRELGAVTDDPDENRLWRRSEFWELRQKSKNNPELEKIANDAYDELENIRLASEARASAKMVELTSAYITMIKAILIEEKQIGLEHVQKLLSEISKVS